MSGTICCIYWTSWTTPLFPTSHSLFFPQESNLRCRKDLRGALRLDLQRRKQKKKHVGSFRDSAYLWDKIIRVTLKPRGVQETLKCGLGKKEVQNPDGILFSMPRETESMVQKILEVSQKRMPRETESTREKSFKTWKSHSDTMKAARKYRWTPKRCTSRYGRDLWLHRCRQHCTSTRVTKRIWNYSRILNLRASKACVVLQEWWSKEIQKFKMYFPQMLRVHFGKKPVLLKEQAIKWTKARVYV